MLAQIAGTTDVGVYSSEIETPHIDSLARDGIKFEAWYSASSICTPSRFGLLTGRYPNRSRDGLHPSAITLREGDGNRGIREGEITIARVLQGIGYRTALIGKWHLGYGRKEFAPWRHGFDTSYGCWHGCVDFFTKKYGDMPDWRRDGEQIKQEGYATDLITQEAVRFIEMQGPDRPFFLYIPYTAPHYGKGWDSEENRAVNILQAKPEDIARYHHIEDEDRRVYAAKVAALDKGVGEVLEALRHRNLEENTFVLFISDNGGTPDYGGSNGAFRGGKSGVFEGGVRVPALARWTGMIPGGVVSSQPASSLDIFSTICRLVGVDVDRFGVDGIDLTPVFFEDATIDRELFWHISDARGSAYRRGPWKYVRVREEQMLFNLDSDPYETTNLSEQRPDIMKILGSRFDEITAGF